MVKASLHEELIIAGFGGQGVLLAGKLLAYTAMAQGLEVTYMPSYGPEVRGGTANCMVVMAGEPVACPLVSQPDALMVLNSASLVKFTGRLKSGGLLVMNSSAIDQEPNRDDIEVLAVPADEIALELNHPKGANMAALGAYLACRGFFGVEAAAEALAQVLDKRYHKTLPVNIEALRHGAEFAAASRMK